MRRSGLGALVMLEQFSGATPALAEALRRFHEELAGAAGANLAGLILCGGLARGRFRPGQSDVNVVVLLHDVSAAALAAIGPALRAARRSSNVAPLIVTPAEVRPAAAVFPINFSTSRTTTSSSTAPIRLPISICRANRSGCGSSRSCGT